MLLIGLLHTQLRALHNIICLHKALKALGLHGYITIYVAKYSSHTPYYYDIANIIKQSAKGKLSSITTKKAVASTRLATAYCCPVLRYDLLQDRAEIGELFFSRT